MSEIKANYQVNEAKPKKGSKRRPSKRLWVRESLVPLVEQLNKEYDMYTDNLEQLIKEYHRVTMGGFDRVLGN